MPRTTETCPARSTPTPSAAACWSPAPGDLRRLVHRRQPLARHLERGEDVVAPAPVRDVEEERARRRRRRRSPTRPSAASGRSPSGARSGGSARRPRARGGAARAASGAVKPVSARLPVSAISRSRPTRSSISAHSAPVRWSFQRIAGRSTRSCVVEADETVHLAGEADSVAVDAEASERCSRSRASQSSGSCSDQPGCGVESGYVSSADETTSPSGVIAIALTPVVPTSRPTSAVTRRRAPRTRARTRAPRLCAAGPRAAPRRRSSRRPSR